MPARLAILAAGCALLGLAACRGDHPAASSPPASDAERASVPAQSRPSPAASANTFPGGPATTADLRAMLDAFAQATVLARLEPWSRAVDSVDAYQQRTALAPWHAQVSVVASTELLRAHFTDGPLDAARAAAARRHVDRLRGYPGLSSGILLNAAAALRPHLPDSAFAALAHDLTNRPVTGCDRCDQATESARTALHAAAR